MCYQNSKHNSTFHCSITYLMMTITFCQLLTLNHKDFRRKEILFYLKSILLLKVHKWLNTIYGPLSMTIGSWKMNGARSLGCWCRKSLQKQWICSTELEEASQTTNVSLVPILSQRRGLQNILQQITVIILTTIPINWQSVCVFNPLLSESDGTT